MKNASLQGSYSHLYVASIACFLLMLAGQSASAQIVYGGFASASNTGSTTLTISNVPVSGTNKLLLVAVGVGASSGNPGGTPPTISSVTYDGATMNLVQATIGNETRENLYSLVNPADGPKNVVVTISSASDVRINARATWFTGVHQTTPLGTPGFDESASSTNPLILNLASTNTGDVVLSTVSVDEGPSNQSITAAGGQTLISNQSGQDYISSALSYSLAPMGGGAVAHTYSFGEAQDHSGIIVAIKPLPPCPVPNCGTVTLVKNP